MPKMPETPETLVVALAEVLEMPVDTLVKTSVPEVPLLLELPEVCVNALVASVTYTSAVAEVLETLTEMSVELFALEVTELPKMPEAPAMPEVLKMLRVPGNAGALVGELEVTADEAQTDAGCSKKCCAVLFVDAPTDGVRVVKATVLTEAVKSLIDDARRTPVLVEALVAPVLTPEPAEMPVLDADEALVATALTLLFLLPLLLPPPQDGDEAPVVPVIVGDCSTNCVE